MSQPLPETWADQVLRKGDLDRFEARMARMLRAPEDALGSLEGKLDSFEARIGRRLFRTFLMTNVLTVLGCFVLVLLARSV